MIRGYSIRRKWVKQLSDDPLYHELLNGSSYKSLRKANINNLDVLLLYLGGIVAIRYFI